MFTLTGKRWYSLANVSTHRQTLAPTSKRWHSPANVGAHQQTLPIKLVAILYNVVVQEQEQNQQLCAWLRFGRLLFCWFRSRTSVCGSVFSSVRSYASPSPTESSSHLLISIVAVLPHLYGTLFLYGLSLCPLCCRHSPPF